MTSEFEVKVKFAPVVSVVAQKSVRGALLYTRAGERTQLKFMVASYPESRISLFRDDVKLVVDRDG